uniref:(northern house mosquito) hypothetical protein n=1 Tax=Culex pipiens TaxID=7175 RepID=A0A8D8P8H2_CULPI
MLHFHQGFHSFYPVPSSENISYALLLRDSLIISGGATDIVSGFRGGETATAYTVVIISRPQNATCCSKRLQSFASDGVIIISCSGTLELTLTTARTPVFLAQ